MANTNHQHLIYVLTLSASVLAGYGFSQDEQGSSSPRVFITTDIKSGLGDPDDRQSLCHLLLYADELDLRGIVPDAFNDRAKDACRIIIDLYRQDYAIAPGFGDHISGYPTPSEIKKLFLFEREEAKRALIREAKREDVGPLYVLAWGNLNFLGDVLRDAPEIGGRIRLLSIGTNVKASADGGDGKQINWNGPGRNQIFDAFPNLWWLEIDWTYNGMFPGPEAIELKSEVARIGGRLGRHIGDAIDTVAWADNFRAGDTPTVMYLITPYHDLDDPTKPSWAGQFAKPFPDERPNYWTGIDGGLKWDYANPERTWHNANEVLEARAKTLLDQRSEFYDGLLQKVQRVYRGVGVAAAKEPTIKTLEMVASSRPMPELLPHARVMLQAETAERTARMRSRRVAEKESGAAHFVRAVPEGAIVWRVRNVGESTQATITIRYRGGDEQRPPILFTNGANLGSRELKSDGDAWTDFTEHIHLIEGLNSIVLIMKCDSLEVDSLTVQFHH